jgi:hypothetical protein
MPQAPSLPSPSAPKTANAANAAEADIAESGAFSEVFEALNGEPDAPRDPEQDADAQRDESAGQMPLPIPLSMFPEKTPRTRFAEELSATLPPGFAQGNRASVLPTPETQSQPAVDVAAVVLPASPVTGAVSMAASPIAGAVSSPASPVAGGPPVQPPVDRAAVAAFPFAQHDAAPQPMPGGAPVPVDAPAIPIRGPQERIIAKGLPQDGSTVGELPATAVAATDPLAVPAETAASGDRSGQSGERGDAARTLAALKEAKASVVHQETHFAPAPQQSPAFQIANRIAHEVDIADPAFTAQASTVPNDASAAPVKILHIQLDPPELGALMIRMSMKDDTLHLQIEASRHETARLIERDQNALSGMLRSAGYNVDGLTVQVSTGDRGNGAQQFSGGNGFNQPAGQHSAGRQPEDSGSGQAWQRAGEPERIAENRRETEAPGAPGRRGGPVYL